MTSDKQSRLLAAVRERFGAKAAITDAADITPWLTDWRGRFHGRSAAILAPASTAEVQAIVAMAADAGTALVAQGGNTSMVGGATPPPDGSALILSLRRMSEVRSISPENSTAVAEAGVILADLHERVLDAGMRFPLTLGSRGSATIGGLTATNAGGTQVLRFGTMRSLVLGLEAVLPDGSLHDGLSGLKKDNRGYSIDQLLIGSEGTLGVITAVALKLVPAITARAVAWAGLDSPQQALELLRFLEARTDRVEGFELVAGDALRLVLKHIPGTRAPLAGEHRWQVLIEATSDQPCDDPHALLERLLADALTGKLCADAMVAASESQIDALWRLRDSLSEAERAEGHTIAYDVSVPVADMPRFIVEASAEVERAMPGTTASAFGHLGDGNVHFHVRAAPGAGPGWYDREGHAATRLVDDLVTAFGGSISAEHGIGQMKIDELERLASPARLHALRSIKQALDPNGLMNPGKLVRPEAEAED